MLIQAYFFLLLTLLMKVLADSADTFLSKFQQSDYKLEFQRSELVRYNKHEIKHMEVVTFKHNRTCAAINVTFEPNFNVTKNLDVIVQAYKFLSNEYRVFPIHFEVDFCDVMITNVLGTAYFGKCGNFSGCPVQKGKIYHLCNFTPDESRLPPFIPSGQYMLEMQAFHHSKELYVTRNFANIYRPIPIPD